MKKLFSAILVVALVLGLASGLTAFAAAGDTFTDGNFVYMVNANTSTVTLNAVASGITLSGDIVIPETVSDGTETYTVTVIGGTGASNPLAQNTAVTSYTLPDTVTTVPYSLFYACTGLKTAKLSAGVTRYQGTFQFCSALEKVEIPEGVTTLVSTFKNCNAAVAVIIPSTVVATEGTKVFEATTGGTLNATSYISAKSSQYINANLRGKTWYLYDDNNIRYTYASESLTISGTLPLASFPNHAVPETLSIPSKVRCGGTTDRNVVACNAYGGFTSQPVKTLILPDGYNEIGACSFVDNKTLETIYIMGNVTLIRSFNGCSNLANVYAYGTVTCKETSGGAGTYSPFVVSTTKYYVKENAGSFVKGSPAAKVAPTPDGAFDANETYIGTFDDKTNPTAITISGIMPGKTLVDDVTVPGTIDSKPVTKIGYQAFLNQKQVTELNLPNTIAEIGIQAFMGMEGLTDFVMPDSVTTLGYGTFYSCKGLESVKLSKNLKGTLQTTFMYCSKLNACVIPEGITTLNRTFAYCHIINTVVIPASVTTITGDDASDMGKRLFSTFDTAGVITGAPTEPGFAVLGAAGSVAETYMTGKGWSFQAIDFNQPLAIKPPKFSAEKGVKLNVVNFSKDALANNLTAICAIYDRTDNSLIDAVLVPVNGAEALSADEYTLTANVQYDKATMYAKSLIWDMTNQKPFAKSQQLLEAVSE